MSSKRVGITLEGNVGKESKFSEFYSLDKRLRSGSYGTVFVTKHKESGEEFAVKVIDRRLVTNNITQSSNIPYTYLVVK